MTKNKIQYYDISKNGKQYSAKQKLNFGIQSYKVSFQYMEERQFLKIIFHRISKGKRNTV